MKGKTIKISIILVILVILVTIGAFVINPSKYSNNKKYEKNIFGSSKPTMTKAKQDFAQKRRHDTKVRIKSNTMASMGDFTFNSGGNTKIVANISLGFKNTEDSFFSSDDAKEEIKKRGVILRSVIIDTMMDNHGLRTNNDKIKSELLYNINSKLSDATATDIYFNQFIVQH